jgi:hypothetical protein
MGVTATGWALTIGVIVALLQGGMDRSAQGRGAARWSTREREWR